MSSHDTAVRDRVLAWCRDAWPSGFAFVVGLVVCFFTLRNGIALTPDGWEYWEGSISLLHGRGYTYYGGAPIHSYPPLFAAYLALVQRVLGETAGGLITGIALLAGLTNALWVQLAARLAAARSSPLPRLLLAAFCAEFVAFSYVALLSEPLFLCFLAAALLAVVSLSGAGNDLGRNLRAVAWISLFATGAALSRNPAIVFLPGLALVVAIRLRGQPTGVRAAASATVVLAPLAIWYAVRVFLEQEGSHPAQIPSLGPILRHLVEASDGFPVLLDGGFGVPGIALALLGIAGLAASVGADYTADSSPAREAAFDVFLVVGSGLAGLVVLMSAVPVADPLTGRFLWFAVLAFAVLLCATASWLADRRHARALLVVLGLCACAQPLRHDALPYRYPTWVTHNQTMSIEAMEHSRASKGALEYVVAPPYAWIVQRRGFALEPPAN